jgi:SNF2 family DNA or RNA helicase
MAAPHGRGSLSKIKDTITYYPHQLEAIRQMAKTRDSWLLADDMGLGKSLEALTLAGIDFEMGRAKKLLIVCPATLKGNWAEEIAKHTNFSYVVVDGTPKKREAQLLDGEFVFDVTIINYELLPKYVDRLNTMGFGIVILDESHYIKGYKSVRTKATHKLVADRFLLVTGTPMLNNVGDLWGQLHRINPRRWNNYFRFMNRYAMFGGFKDKQVVGIKNESELRAEVASVMIRRRKEDVLDLPEKRHIDIVVGLSELQERLYAQAESELQIDLPGEPEPMELENSLVKALKLKQICGTTATIPGYEDSSEKLDEVVARTMELYNTGRKVVIFTQFRDVLYALVQRLNVAGIGGIPVLHGDVNSADRASVVREWSDDPDPKPIVCMLQVAAAGLNMTAASVAFFVDELWSPMMNQQAEDRIHRIGAEGESVEYYRFLCKGTVEYRVRQIIKKKLEMKDAVIEESDWKRAVYKALRGEES